MNKEGELSDLVKLIFGKQILPVNSIQIVDSFESVKDLFESLLMIFTNGTKRLFGTDTGVDLSSLSIQDFNKIYLRFLSIGIKINYEIYHLYEIFHYQNISIDNDILKDYKNYIPLEDKSTTLNEKKLKKYNTLNSNILKDYYFQLNCNKLVYIIHFDII